ncbi:MAG: hypothetical protein O2910_01115 [Proteobacteria bacterium]|nr:hypothetical protein [Pseudomonadota bacterium]
MTIATELAQWRNNDRARLTGVLGHVLSGADLPTLTVPLSLPLYVPIVPAGFMQRQMPVVAVADTHKNIMSNSGSTEIRRSAGPGLRRRHLSWVKRWKGVQMGHAGVAKLPHHLSVKWSLGRENHAWKSAFFRDVFWFGAGCCGLGDVLADW